MLNRISFFLFLMFVPPLAASGATIQVPVDYTTIQKAVNAAKEGDIIKLASGTFYEYVIIDKKLSLIGSGSIAGIGQSTGEETGDNTAGTGTETIIKGGINLSAVVDLADLSVIGGVSLSNVSNSTIKWQHCSFLGKIGTTQANDVWGMGEGGPGSDAASIVGNFLVLEMDESEFYGGKGGPGSDAVYMLSPKYKGGPGGIGLTIQGSYPTIIGGTFYPGAGGAGGSDLEWWMEPAPNGLPGKSIKSNNKANRCPAEEGDPQFYSCAPYVTEMTSASQTCFMDLPVVSFRPVSPIPERAITSITADLSSLGLDPKTPLFDDGTHGDALATDGNYAFQFTVPMPDGDGETVNIPFTITDDNGVVGSPAIEMVVNRCGPTGQAAIENIAQNTLVVTATAQDVNGSVASVVADLTDLNGDAASPMNDDGLNGDTIAGDGNYSFTFTLPDSFASGIKIIKVLITDNDGLTTTIENKAVIANEEVVLEDFESGYILPWEWISDLVLDIDSSGYSSNNSMYISGNKSSAADPAAEVSLPLLSSGYVSFYYRVGMDGNFAVFLDNENILSRQEGGPWNDGVDWTLHTNNILLGSGQHTLRFEVSNSPPNLAGWPCQAWIDKITFKPDVTATTSTTSTTTTAAPTTTSTEALTTTTTTTIMGNTSVILPVSTGWSLLSSSIGFQTTTVFGDTQKFTSVWKWTADGKGAKSWAVYLPGEDGGAAYANSKGFMPLSTISPGEGFWVNGKTDEQLMVSGTPGYGELSFSKGWNLMGVNSTQPMAVADLGPVTSVWKWTTVEGVKTWAVNLPGKDDKGASYASSKGFGQFITIEPGEGFWVNTP